MKQSSTIDNKTILFVQECKRSPQCNGYHSNALAELRRAFKPLKKSGYTLIFENLVQNLLPEGKKPTKAVIAENKPTFVKIFKKHNPKYTIPLGAVVTSTFTKKNKFSKLVGRRIESSGYSIIPIYHPDYATKSKERQREYETQIRSVINQIEREGKPLKACKYKLHIGSVAIVTRLYALAEMNCVQSFDWETEDLDPKKGELVCINISHRERQGECLYFYKNLTPSVRKALKHWLTSSVPKVAHNAKFEIKWALHHLGVEPANIVGDTQQMHHLIDETVKHRLSDLAYIYTDMGGYDMPMEEFLAKGNRHCDADPEFMLPYAAGDSDCTLRLYNVFRPMIKEMMCTWLEKKIVMPTVFTLARVENRGMKIDYKELDKVEEEIKQETKKIQRRINGYPETRRTLKHFQIKNPKLKEVNLNSPVQMQYLLFDACKLPVLEQSKKTRKPSTDKNVLDQLKDKHKLVHYIVDMRQLEHQLVEIEEIRAKRSKDDTIYSDLIQDYVVTGRLSSRNPNLQNMTKGSKVRRCFISRHKKGKILQADYDQLELRLIASETGDPSYMTSFKRKEDPHLDTAKRIYEKESEDVIKDERDKAKRVNYGVVYGITEHGLSKQLNVPIREAKELLSKYWQVYRPVKKWMKKNVAEAQNNLSVRSRLGRRRQLPDIHSQKWWLRESAERSASNTKIQSLGADITMWSFTNVDNTFIKAKLKSEVICQAHDSIIVDLYPGELRKVVKILKDVMERKALETFYFLRLPLTTSVEVGDRWSEIEKVKI